jgi:hypothetical protein
MVVDGKGVDEIPPTPTKQTDRKRDNQIAH